MAIPNIVTGIRVVNQVHDNRFWITWQTQPSTVTYCNVYRSSDPFTGFTKIIKVLSPDNFYIDALPVDWTSKVVFYKVTANNNDGESDLATTQALTDTDIFKWMAAPYFLNIDYSKDYNWAYNVAPTGTVNGTNKIFYLPFNYVPKSLQVSINGLKLATNQFIERTSNSFATTVAPAISSTIECNFVKF